ncbi:DUF6099 family protein [Streptomyces sp. JJ38]|uniref:DUF6099 family protein n=1 Tax=Streptomyces sp. JJ38 TaxID=2738128 RepID=UPI001C59725E|nr:DUF6099 family protein [Streptomyces sp. JJ38]MBW1595608.1 hypothetical protein [Streptomyces sp. JJ38]
MDAVRLIGISRSALARCGDGAQIVAEAWQAQALAQAVGRLLADSGPPQARPAADALARAGVRLRSLPGGAAEVRAVRLTGVREPHHALEELAGFLAELCTALVEVAAGAEEESLYWHCLEALDAAGEAADHAVCLRGSLPRVPS